MWDIIRTFFLPAGLALGLFCVARLIASALSEQSRASLRDRPITHGLLALVALALVALGLTTPLFPPKRAEKFSVRRLALSRVSETGGWNAFKRECQLLLVESKATGRGSWFPRIEAVRFSDRYHVISALQPLEIQVVTSSNQPSYAVFKLFDEKTGGQGSFYALIYQETTNTLECLAANRFQGVSPEIIVDSVFEVY